MSFCMWTKNPGGSKHIPLPARSRREFLERTGSGFGLLALNYLLGRDQLSAAETQPNFQNPLAAKPPHYPAKAKSVIYLFMHGGPSHVDTFDPKPLLAKYDGQPAPSSIGDVFLQF